MKISPRILVPALLLGAPLSFAAEPAAAPQAAASAPAASTIDVSTRGSLRDVLKTIAEKGGLNLVATGDLDVPAEVHLRGVTAAQALNTVARAYSLRLEQDGAIITLRRMTPEEKEAVEQGRAQMPVIAPVAPAAPAATPAPAPVAEPQPPQPPAPPEAHADAEAAEDAEEELREMREQIRAQFRRTRDELKRSNRSGGRNVVARGQSLEVKAGQSVHSAVVYGGNLTVNGHVEDDAVAFGGNLEIRGVVEGDAHAFGGNVILKPGAQVEGDVSSFGGTVEREDGSDVEGSINTFGGANIGRIVSREITKGIKEAGPPGHHAEHDDDNENDLASFILTFAVLFGLGFLGQMFFPKRMKQLGDEIRTRPMQSGLTGLLGIIAMVPLTVVLCITIIGVPVALALWMAAPVAAAMGFAAMASEVGTRLPVMRGRKTQAVVLALGLVVMLVALSIPVLGVILTIFATMVALGAVIRIALGYRGRGSGIPEPISTASEQPL